MKLIDGYVYAVTEHLNNDIKEDISKELRANIEDMLPDDPTEADVREVLEKLGNPKKLASEYSDNKRYLIGPELYDNYIYVLKLVAGIVAAVAVCAVFLERIVSSQPDESILENSIGTLVSVISGGIEGAVQGALWVTIIFVILERTGTKTIDFNNGKVSILKNKWSVDDLPDLPVNNKGRISRGDTIFSMIFTAIFTAVIYSKAHVIGIYTKSEDGIILAESLFVDERLKFYMPLFLIVALFQFSVYAWKFVARKWSIALAVVNTICNGAACILMYVMLSDAALFNEGFVKKLMETTHLTNAQLPSIWPRSISIFIIVFVLIALWDSISGFLKCKKKA